MDEHICCEGLIQWIPTEFFKALSDPNRVTILTHLAESGKEHTVSQVSTCCPVDFSVVSRHLRTLKNAGLVRAEKRGKEVYYTVRASELVSVLRNLADAIENCCPDKTGSSVTKPEDKQHDDQK